MAERIPVPVQAPAPFIGDEVYLLPTLPLEGGAAAELDLLDVGSIGDEHRRTLALVAKWTVTYVRYGAVGWNWQRVSESGQMEPVPFDVEILLADYQLSRAVAEKANDLYGNGDRSPLLRGAVERPNRQQRRSRTGPTEPSTSRRPASTTTRSRSSSAPSSDGPQLKAVG